MKLLQYYRSDWGRAHSPAGPFFQFIKFDIEKLY